MKMLVKFLHLFIKNSDNSNSQITRTAYGNIVGIIGVVFNILLFLFKFTVGFISGSVAIVGDAFNNITDATTSIITIIGFKLAARPADKKHPFGHARYEYLAGLLMAVIILILGVELAQISFEQITSPQDVKFNIATAVVLIASILIKLGLMLINAKIGGIINSPVLHAAAADSRNDAIGTFAVFTAMLFSHYTNINLDGYLGMIVAIIIFASGIKIIKQTISPLLGEAVSQEQKEKIENKIMSYDGVLGTHDLILHDYGPNKRFGSAHVEMNSSVDVMHSHNIIDDIERDILSDEGIKFVIHYDPILVGDEIVDGLKTWVKSELSKINERINMHDFRVVSGPKHTNLIFDVEVPFNFKYNDEELKEIIQSFANNKPVRYFTVVTIDRV